MVSLLIFYLCMALFVPFLCSLLEACLLSLPRAYISLMIKRGQGAGPRLKKMKAHVDEPLIAILTFSTIAHTVGAVGVGAQVLELWKGQYLGIASALLTLLILSVSQILPKSLGSVYAKALAPFAAYAIRLLLILTWPVLVTNRFLARIWGGGQNPHPPVRE